MSLIGIYGGTFDPVHKGHLALANAAHDVLALDKVIFVPLGVPPHRPQPIADANQRVNMLHAALESHPNFEVDRYEIDKPEPSWTVNSLKYFHEAMPDDQLCLLLGSDAFKPINTWYRWRSILDYCHIVIVSRQNDPFELDDEVEQFFHAHNIASLGDAMTGSILHLKETVPDISSTQVRCAAGDKNALSQMLPDTVMDYIEQQGLYQ